MKKYTVRSGQNIYDVAVTIHGSVEGIFDLLASNPRLTMETTLQYGMELNYNEGLSVNKNIANWLSDRKIVVKNGEHTCRHTDMEEYMEKYFHDNHPNFEQYMASMSADEQNMFWETQCTPRMVIRQSGQLSTIRFELKEGKHMFIDWGDTSGLQDFGCTRSGTEEEVEHYYKGGGQHIITIYGDCEFVLLDITDVHGIHFPLGTLYADTFISDLNIEKLNKLIITS